jgi:hypothetical protein
MAAGIEGHNDQSVCNGSARAKEVLVELSILSIWQLTSTCRRHLKERILDVCVNFQRVIKMTAFYSCLVEKNLTSKSSDQVIYIPDI